MKALSIRQPWAWLILNAGKDIENRRWPTRFRGRLLIHAGLGMDYPRGVLNELVEAGLLDAAQRLREVRSFQCGGIVGSVVIVGCVRRSDSPWFDGPFGFVLRDPQPMRFTPCPGSVGFFEVSGESLS